MNLLLWSKLLRIPNLAVAGLSIFMVFSTLLRPYFFRITGLTYFLLLLEIFTIWIIMAGGNIFNDYCDENSDRINRSGRVIIGIHLSKEKALDWYRISIILTSVLSVVIYIFNKSLILLLIHFLTIITLYFYSKSLKKRPLIGNLTVAFLCAMVFPVTPLLFSAEMNFDWWTIEEEIRKVIILFFAFSFFTTLWRELVKDLEDQEGDQKSGYFTLPLIWSEEKIKYLGYLIVFFLFSLLLYVGMQYLADNEIKRVLYTLGLLVSLIFLTFLFRGAETKKQHHTLSQYLKIYMLQGLFLMLLY